MEISLSIIAWVSVVLIQAIVHYFVFGSRRRSPQHMSQQQEQQQENDDQAEFVTTTVDECISLATHESFRDAAAELWEHEDDEIMDGHSYDDEDDGDDHDYQSFGATDEYEYDNDMDQHDANYPHGHDGRDNPIQDRQQPRSRSSTPRRRRSLSATSSASQSPRSSIALRDVYYVDRFNKSTGGIYHRATDSSSISRQTTGTRRRSSLSPTINRTVLKIGGDVTRLSIVNDHDNNSSSNDDDDNVVLEPSPHALSQTGTEMLRSCSVENIVFEQIRAVPQ